MEKDSDSSTTQNLRVDQQPIAREWMVRIFPTILGLGVLSVAIQLLQYLAIEAADKRENLVLVTNWIPWLAVLFFALGWFTTHGFEIALLKKQVRIVKILFLALVFEGGIIFMYFRYFIDHEVLNRFGVSSVLLVWSGALLRYSVFSLGAFATQQKILSEMED